MSIDYLKGLNSLRFFAAFFVIISHGQMSLRNLGVVGEQPYAIFERGGDGVEFFFTLSGFLITYLLIRELESRKDISLKKFYLRRVFRIWPLYFLIVAIGFIFLGVVYPRITHESFFNFKIVDGLALFLFFVPNIATSLYATGLMYPLWSIGVEEQYYLFWAPCIKLFRGNVLPFILFFLIISYAFYFVGYNNYFNVDERWLKFFKTLKFYAMAMGGLFAYIYAYKKAWFERSVFSTSIVQAIVLGILVYHFFIGFPFSWMLWFHLILSVLFALVIINVILPRSIIKLEIQPFTYLGVISYGLYMYHMSVDYFLRFFCMKYLKVGLFNSNVVAIVYQVCLFGMTILIAGLSYKYLESYFLRLKQKFA